jgi:hypothetical protein
MMHGLIYQLARHSFSRASQPSQLNPHLRVYQRMNAPAIHWSGRFLNGKTTPSLGWMTGLKVHYFGKKLLIGLEESDGRVLPMPVYLFRCGNCREYATDYPRGFSHRRYLHCPSCSARIEFVPSQERFAHFWELVHLAFVAIRMG